MSPSRARVPRRLFREIIAPAVQPRRHAGLLLLLTCLAAVPLPVRSQGESGTAATPATAGDIQQPQVPSCAIQNKGYTDPSVPILNGGLTLDALSCQRKCAADDNCKVFTYYELSTGCWLQGLDGTVPDLEDIQGAWSGPKVCPEAQPDAPPLSNIVPDWVKDVPGEAQEVAQEVGEEAEEEAEDVLRTVEHKPNRTNESLQGLAEDGIEEVEEVIEKTGGFPLWIGGAFLITIGIVYLVFGGGFDGAARRHKCGALISDWHTESVGSDSESEESSQQLPRTRSRFSSRTRG